MKTRFAFLFCLILVVGCNVTPPRDDPSLYKDDPAEVITRTNTERTMAGLDPLKADDQLAAIAQKFAVYMATNNVFEHNADGRGPGGRLQDAGYHFRTYGENIAMGYKHPVDVVQGWMRSPGHRANILNSGLTNVGVGVALDSKGRPYWVQLFATPPGTVIQINIP